MPGSPSPFSPTAIFRLFGYKAGMVKRIKSSTVRADFRARLSALCESAETCTCKQTVFLRWSKNSRPKNTLESRFISSELWCGQLPQTRVGQQIVARQHPSNGG